MATIHGGRGSIALALATLLAVFVATGCNSEESAAGGSPGAPDGSRIASARAYQGGEWTVAGETPEVHGRRARAARADLRHSLVRFQAGEAVTAREVSAWKTIRDKVLAASPQAQFSIELNGLEYPTAAKLEAMMPGPSQVR